VVSLPLAVGSAELAPEAPRTVATRPLDVLIVEDNADAAETLCDVLELTGNRVRVAPDGRTGIALARAWRPDVVLCDIGLPDLDGFEVARAIRSDPALQRARLVALSGYAQEEDRARARSAGFDVVLAKPAPIEALEAVLAQAALR
jgi:CheY-like chemotaxis protein